MAVYTTLVIKTPTKAGITDFVVGADTQGADGFKFANDGKTILLVTTVEADTLTLTDVVDRYGRQETPAAKAVAIGAGKVVAIGPFLEGIWNQVDGTIIAKFTTAIATTKIAAVKVVPAVS